MACCQPEQQHFLLVSVLLQSHINPTLQLATYLTRSGIRVTFSTSICAHRRMFPDNPTFPLVDPKDPLLSYHPYSDGFDDGFDPSKDSHKEYFARIKVTGRESLLSVASSVRPTCIIYALLLPWAAEVATELEIPSALFWIQPASVFAVYYNYFHGYRQLIESNNQDPSFPLDLPGLPPLKIRDLPSFLATRSESGIYDHVIPEFEEAFRTLDGEVIPGAGQRWCNTKPKVIVNSFQSLEPTTFCSMEKVELIPIGPLLPPAALLVGILNSKVDTTTTTTRPFAISRDLIHAKDDRDYMEWLNRWPEKSVIYVSFGSLSLLGKKQNVEISKALKATRRPYLWVVRGETEGVEVDGEMGMAVDWCSQVEVLSHRSVGCFVSHCGWNSTLESLVCGVPMVCFPQWTDQGTNAWLAEEVWGVGVRTEVNDQGIMEESELRRCLTLVMGQEGDRLKDNAEAWREKAKEAMQEGGSSSVNLEKFVMDVKSSSYEKK